MNHRRIDSRFVICVALAWLAATPVLAENPNVLIIIADDLGYNDVSYNGSVIRTPTLEGLAELL